MTELRPCPFCGGEAKHGYDGDPIFGRIVHWVYCKECHAKTRESSDEDFVIESWNNRPSPWHTGEPTEKGDYFCVFKRLRRDDDIVYGWCTWDGATWDIYLNAVDSFICTIAAWQKIEPPYKEISNG